MTGSWRYSWTRKSYAVVPAGNGLNHTGLAWPSMISGPSTASGAALVGVTKMSPRATAGLVVSTVIGTGWVSGDGAAASTGAPPSGAATCAKASGLGAAPSAASATSVPNESAVNLL